MTISLFFTSRLSCKSFQNVAIRNPVDVKAEYAIKPHCKAEIGKAHIKAVIKKLVKE